jgi:hypothetical protein
LKKRCPSRYRKPPGHQIDITKIKPLHHIILKTISTVNKKRIQKVVRDENQITYKGKSAK